MYIKLFCNKAIVPPANKASITLNINLSFLGEQIKGNAEGELNVGAVNAGLKASLDKLSAECNDIADIAIKYYATDLPDKLPTTMEDLVLLIEKFPSRLKNLNDGKGIPISVRFSPDMYIIFASSSVYIFLFLFPWFYT